MRVGLYFPLLGRASLIERMWMMRCFLCALFSALLVTATVVHAQEAPPAEVDPTVTSWTAEKIDNPPKRDLKFERSDEPLEQRLPTLASRDPFSTRVDPSVLEQKFVAVLRVNKMPPLVFNDPSAPPVSQQFAGLVQATPKDRLPAEAEVKFFTSPDINHGYLEAKAIDERTLRRGPPKLVEIRILAPTAELAEARAAAMLTLFDQGDARTLQQETFQAHQKLATQWRQAREEAEAAEAKIPAIDKALEAFEDVTADMLPALRAQRLQIEVERIGVKAEIEAAQKLMAEGNRETQQKIESLLLPAQIRLASFEAKQAYTDRFIAKAKEKAELTSQLSKLNSQRDSRRRLERQTASELAQQKNRLGQYAPLKVIDNVVHIRPVKWVK